MKPLLNYFKEMYLLTGGRARLLIMVLAMGTLLGCLDLACIGLLAKLVGATSQHMAMIQFSALSREISLSLSELGTTLIALYVLRVALGISFNYAIFRRTGEIEANLRANLLAYFTLMPYEQRLNRTVGSLVTTVNQWTMSFARAVIAPLLRFFCDAMVGILILLYLLILYPITVLVLLSAGTCLAFIYDRTLKKTSIKNAREYRALSEEISETNQQALAGYKEIRVHHFTDFFVQHVRQRSTRMGHALAISNTIGQSPRLIIEAILVTFAILALLYLSYSGRDITQELPQLAMFTFVILRVSSLASLTTATVSNLRLHRGVVSQLAADYRSDISTELAAAKLHHASNSAAAFQSLEVSQLEFHYETTPQPIISNLSFSLRDGDALAIIGESGAGKTTLVDLLLGILKPTAGTIAVSLTQNGANKQQSDFMGVASYLSQNTFLINDTLRRNVALGVVDAEIDDARVILALQKAKLPQYTDLAQLDAIVGDRGARLSGGQRQRVALARAFYHGHRVMILDEATNAIDLVTEIEIVKDLLALRPEITLITITHRPEIAKLFPRKLDLSEGLLT